MRKSAPEIRHAPALLLLACVLTAIGTGPLSAAVYHFDRVATPETVCTATTTALITRDPVSGTLQEIAHGDFNNSGDFQLRLDATGTVTAVDQNMHTPAFGTCSRLLGPASFQLRVHADRRNADSQYQVRLFDVDPTAACGGGTLIAQSAFVSYTLDKVWTDLAMDLGSLDHQVDTGRRIRFEVWLRAPGGGVRDVRLRYGTSAEDSVLTTTETVCNATPSVTITAPADGSSFNLGDTIGFTGTATDAEDGDLTASLAWTSSIDGAIGSGGSFSTSGLAAGTHTITASVTDSGGTTGQDQITITVNAPPVVTISSPADGATFNQGDTINFAGAASDAEDGDLSTGLAWTSSIDGAIGSGGSFSTSALSVGTHTITASVTDSGGAAGQDQISVTVNAANATPVVTITSPADGATFNQGDTVGFTGTASDAEDGDLTAGLAWTSSIDGAIGSGGSFSTATLSVGTHTITASVTDSGGATGQDQISVTVNVPGNTPPVVTITSPTDGATFNQGDTVNFAGTASDAEDGDLTASLGWTSSIDGAIGTGGSFATALLSPGSHTITASVTDSGSATGQDQISITVVTGADNATTVLSNTANVSSCRQITVISTFSGDDDDDGSTLVEFKLAADSVWSTSCSAATGASPRQCLVTGLAETETYDVRVTFTDPDNSPQPPPQTLAGITLGACTADADPPTLLVLSPRRNGVLNGVDRLKVQVFDAFPLAATTPVRYSIDGGAFATDATVNGSYNCNVPADASGCAIYEIDLDTTALANGDHDLTVEATDEAGNVALLSWPFRVNNTVGGSALGGGLLLRRTHGSQLCVDCHSLPTHSSQSTSTQYGNWALDCMTCHTPHNTPNIFLIRSNLRTPNSGRKLIKFHRDDRTGETNPGDVPGNFSFLGERDPANSNLPYNDGVCEACHTKTKHWRNDTAGGGDHLHNANVRCLACHQHETGFRGSGACLDCHGNAGDAGTQGVNARRPVLADFGQTSHHVGTQSGLQLIGSLSSFDCVVCHAEGKVEVGPQGPEVVLTQWHNDGQGASSSAQPHRIDLKDVDNWDDVTEGPVFHYDKDLIADGAPTVAEWGSVNAVWRTQTSTALDPFCLTCHDSDGALVARNTTDAECAGVPDGTNPFCDDAITNDYDQRFRNPADPLTGPGRVVDIKSKVVADVDRDGDGIADPPQGIFSRHAIRGQSASVYTEHDPAVLPAICGANGDEPCSTIFGGDPDSGNQPLLVQTGALDDGGRPLWNDTSVMGCADCHTVDGANGSLGNAHGSPSEYLLKDAGGGSALGTLADLSYVCYRCHDSRRYQFSGAFSPHTGRSNDWVDAAGLIGPANRLAADGNIFGLACTNCHGSGPGSDNAFTGQPDPPGFGFGQIHGTSSIYRIENSTTNTRNGYRFMNGASLRFYNPVAWQDTDIACFTLGGTGDEWGGCTQHTSPRGWTKPLMRSLRY